MAWSSVVNDSSSKGVLHLYSYALSFLCLTIQHILVIGFGCLLTSHRPKHSYGRQIRPHPSPTSPAWNPDTPTLCYDIRSSSRFRVRLAKVLFSIVMASPEAVKALRSLLRTTHRSTRLPQQKRALCTECLAKNSFVAPRRQPVQPDTARRKRLPAPDGWASSGGIAKR